MAASTRSSYTAVVRFVLLLLLAAPLRAQTADGDALVGMDEEVRENWARAVEAFARSGGENPTPRQHTRLRYAKKRGTDAWRRTLKELIDAKRYDELPMAVALARLVNPKDSTVARAARIAKSKGLAIPAVPPQEQDQAKEFPYRSPGGRLRSWTPALPRAEAMIDKALDWLVKGQSEKGHWDAKAHGAAYGTYDTGVTSLALLALTARGPAGLAGARGAAAQKAVKYLVAEQVKSGGFNDVSYKAIYITAYATEALAEYAVIANRRKELRPVLERARDHLLDVQTPGLGWRYERREKKCDTAVTGRVVFALERLRRAGIAVPAAAFEGALRWTDSMTDRKYGQIGYDLRGGSMARPKGMHDRFPPEQSQSMTATGCLVNFYAGRIPSFLNESFLLFWEAKPRASNPDMYYWCVGARAWQAACGTVPRDWYAPMVASIAKCVAADGGMLAKGPWQEAGRVYATAMCVLALATPYREPPVLGATTFFKTKTHAVRVTSVTATGIYLDAGMTVKTTARDGVVAWRDGVRVGPEGTKHAPEGLKPLVRGNFGCLLARIGPEGKPFRVKDGMVRARAPGQLYLLVNDANPEDNAEGWTVTLELATK